MTEKNETKQEFKDITSVLKELSIAVPVSETKTEEEKIIQTLSKSVSIKGFRKGKVPLELIKNKYKQNIEEELLEKIIQDKVKNFFEKSDLMPISTPSVKELDYSLGNPLSFTVEFEIRPELDIQGYKDIKVDIEKIKVSNKEVDEEIENLRKRAAQLDPVEGRGVIAGDLLTMSGTFTEPHGDHSHTHEIGRRNYPMPDQKSEFSNFDKQIEGMTKGDEKSFEIEVDNERLGKSLKGKHIEFNVKIEEIHTVQLPEVDDEFAKSLGEFEDLKTLKEEIKNSLIELKKSEERRKAGDTLLDKVIDKNEFEIPKAYIEDEINNIINYKATQLLNMGINLRHNPIDWEKMREDVREDASKNVARMMTLINIADKEEIKVDEKEVEEKVKDIADQRKVSNTKLLADFKKSGEYDRIKTDILFTKTVDFLFEINHIKIG